MKNLMLETKLILARSASNDLKIPKPDEKWKERLEELTEGKLIKQRAAIIHDMRVEQAEKIGLKQMTGEEAVELLMGEPHTETEEGEDAMYDYSYFHHEDELIEGEEVRWRIPKAEIFINKIKKGPWFLPPFKAQPNWKAHHVTKLDQLKKQIPHEVVIGINGLKRLKFFNAFYAIEDEDGNAIILGNLWEVPPNDDGSRGHKANRTTGFFLAKF
jgi:hypothetical protein